MLLRRILLLACAAAFLCIVPEKVLLFAAPYLIKRLAPHLIKRGLKTYKIAVDVARLIGL